MFTLRKSSRKLEDKPQFGTTYLYITLTTNSFCPVYVKNSYSLKGPKRWTISVDENVKQPDALVL